MKTPNANLIAILLLTILFISTINLFYTATNYRLRLLEAQAAKQINGNGPIKIPKPLPTNIGASYPTGIGGSMPTPYPTNIGGSMPTPYPTYIGGSETDPRPTRIGSSAPSPIPTSIGGSEPTLIKGVDETWCRDADAGSYFVANTSCQDNGGIYYESCTGSTVNEYYCSGTWDGSSYTKVHCAKGSYYCTSPKTCSQGACL